MDKKLTTLADLFRPPIDLMHKGSFETVRAHVWLQILAGQGVRMNLWLHSQKVTKDWAVIFDVGVLVTY